MNLCVQRVCGREMYKPQLAPLALQMNSESCAGQMFCPQATCNISLVVETAEEVMLLNANANFPQNRKVPVSKLVLVFFIFYTVNTDLCVFLKSSVKTSRTGTGRQSITHAGLKRPEIIQAF